MKRRVLVLVRWTTSPNRSVRRSSLRVCAQLALSNRTKGWRIFLKLARYLSRQVYQSIFQGRQDARIGSNRKKLTVFFLISSASPIRPKT